MQFFHERISLTAINQADYSKLCCSSICAVLLYCELCSFVPYCFPRFPNIQISQLCGSSTQRFNCIWCSQLLEVLFVLVSFIFYFYGLCFSCVSCAFWCVYYVYYVYGPSAWNKTDDDWYRLKKSRVRKCYKNAELYATLLYRILSDYCSYYFNQYLLRMLHSESIFVPSHYITP